MCLGCERVKCITVRRLRGGGGNGEVFDTRRKQTEGYGVENITVTIYRTGRIYGKNERFDERDI